MIRGGEGIAGFRVAFKFALGVSLRTISGKF